MLPGIACLCRIALFHLEEYEAAKEVFEAGQAVAAADAQLKTWIRKCVAELEGACTHECARRPSTLFDALWH